VIRWQPG